MSFLIKENQNLFTGKTYHHNFQWLNFEEENCIFYTRHKKEIKLIESKNLWSTMNIFFIKNSNLKIPEINNDIKTWISASCNIFSAFDEDNWWFYYFLPYFQTKFIDEKNNIFKKIWLKIELLNSQKWVLVKDNEWNNQLNIENLNTQWELWFLFWLIILYWKFEKKWDKLSSIKIQLPLFWQFLTIWNRIKNIQKNLQDNWIFIQISENIQWDRHTYEITSNDYELLEIFSNLYLPVEKFTQITKREQTQEAINALKTFLLNEWEKEIIEKIDNSCIKLLQKI